MFEILMLILFCWLFFGVLRLMLKATWGLFKLLALILVILALPSIIAVLLMAGGALLLLPVALVALAFGILKIC